VDWRAGAAYALTLLSGLCGREAVAGLMTGFNMGAMMAQIRTQELHLPLLAVCPDCLVESPRVMTHCPHCLAEGKRVKLILELDYSKGKNESGS
jgi:hypothetical protein